MLRQKGKLIARGLTAIDLVITFFAFLISIEMRANLEVQGRSFTPSESVLIIQFGTALFLSWFLGQALGIARPHRYQKLAKEAGLILVANAIILTVLLAISMALHFRFASRLQLSLFVALNCSFSIAIHVGIRLALRYARRRGFNTRNVILAGNTLSSLTRSFNETKSNQQWGLKVIGRAGDFQIPSEAEELKQLVKIQPDAIDEFLNSRVVDEIWLDYSPAFGTNFSDLVEAGERRGIVIRRIVAPRPGVKVHFSFEPIGSLATLEEKRTSVDETSLAAKRALDLLLSSLATLLAAPLLIGTAIAVAVTSKGPVFFRQVRVGRNGRHFVMLKFRSMVQGAEKQLDELRTNNQMSGPVFKIDNDPRVTPIGNFIRRTSIDELPQLLNVLRGDMSLVGPRPSLPEEVCLYEPDQRRRLSVRPGITGLWQVNGRNDIKIFRDRVALDLEYIDDWSLGLDLQILVRTVPAVLVAKGAS